MSEQKPVFRFAPSPNGELHLGHAYSALLNLKLAREMGGKILLRIEDIDLERCTRELERKMLKDLEWIGFEWDEEPIRQSERFGTYRNALVSLEANGLIYPATMSRGEIRQFVKDIEKGGKFWPRDPDDSPHYPGSERDLDHTQREILKQESEAYAMRLDAVKALSQCTQKLSWQEWNAETSQTVFANSQEWGDVILARKDTPASYHLCCVLDDADQKITHIVRGQDLYNSTSMHVLLQKVLGLPTPLYRHHKLVTDESGRKLSKSEKDTSISQLRKSGLTADDIRQEMLPRCF